MKANNTLGVIRIFPLKFRQQMGLLIDFASNVVCKQNILPDLEILYRTCSRLILLYSTVIVKCKHFP